MAKITLSEEIKELERELEFRKKAYPNLVSVHQMEKPVSEYRISCLEAVIQRLKKEQVKVYGEQPLLF